MHIPKFPLTILALAAALAAASAPALADEATPPQAVPLEKPPGPSQVPVPDVRGMTEAEATSALREAGLGLGGVERVAKERLESAYGQKYAIDMVVQQAPPPSAGDSPSWLKRGGLVWLRVAVRSDREIALPPTATDPGPVAPPTLRYGDTRTPVTTPPRAPVYATGPVPPRPAPPYALGGTAALPTPRDIVPAPPLGPGTAPLTTTTQPAVPAARSAAAAPCFTLSCERKENGWHVRGLAGAAFFAGLESGTTGLYAGADIGYTMCNCLGIDVFYRFAASTFDRNLPNGLLEDSGDWHTVGLKATFDKTFNATSRWYWSAGLGAGYFKSRRYQEDDSGLAGYAEFGVGYMLSNSIRARLGLDVHAMKTTTGRLNPASADGSRMLWILAPVLGVEIDI